MEDSHSRVSPDPSLLEWLRIRDHLVGNQKSVEHNVTQAIALARNCKHPDAVWLTAVFEDAPDSTIFLEDESHLKAVQRVYERFLHHGEDARGLCFASLLGSSLGREPDNSKLVKAANMKYAFAQAVLSARKKGVERYALLHAAAEQGEREAFSWLGKCYNFGLDGVARDYDKAKKFYLQAALLNDCSGCIGYGSLIRDENSLSFWKWYAKAACLGENYWFLSSFPLVVRQCLTADTSLSNRTLFAIGRELKGNIDHEMKHMFGPVPSSMFFSKLLEPATQAVQFYEKQTQAARMAVDAWTIVAIRFFVVKDIRRLIASHIWEDRLEANYKTKKA